MTARRHFGVRRLAAAFRGDTGAPTENCMGGTDGIVKAGASSRTPRPAFAGTMGGQKQIPRVARDDKSRVTGHESRLPPAGRRRPLHGGKSGEFGGGDGFLLEEDLEAFAHAFGEDERFELQAGADAVGFIHAVVVEVGELVSLP